MSRVELTSDRFYPKLKEMNRRCWLGRRGFTLLEMCLVMVLIFIVFSFSVPALEGIMSEERLRDPARQLELYAKTARSLAVEKKTAYEVLILPTCLQLQPFLEKISESASGMESPSRDRTETNEGEEEVRMEYGLSKEVILEVKDVSKEKWVVFGEFHWVFQPSGLCEPLSVRFSRENTWIEMTFSPLTGMVVEESYSF